MSKSIISVAKSAINELRNLIGAARQNRADLAEQLSALEAEKRALLKAPLNRADVESILRRDVAAQQKQALQADSILHSEIESLQTRSISAQLSGTAANYSPFESSQFSSSLLDKLLLIIATPAEIVARLKPALDSLDYKKAGPPLTERRVKIAGLDAKIADLQAELSQFAELLSDTDVGLTAAAPGPAMGERRCFDGGHWATWGQMTSSGSPGWIFDPKPGAMRHSIQ